MKKTPVHRIEEFLTEAQEHGDNDIRQAAEKLLQLFREKYKTSIPSKELDAKIQIDGLSNYLETAVAKGISAWPRVRQLVLDLNEKYSEFHKKMPPEYVSRMFAAKDGSWTVYLTREGVSPFFETQLVGPESNN